MVSVNTSDITTGAKVGNWQVLGVDGRRAHAHCVCGTVRVLAIASLLDGTAAPSCGCAPISSEQVALRRHEPVVRFNLTPKIEPFS